MRLSILPDVLWGLPDFFFIFLRTSKIEDLILSLRFFGLLHTIALMVSPDLSGIPFYCLHFYEGTIDAYAPYEALS